MKKTINIFLASSITEFKHERNEIGDLIRRLQDVLIDHDIYLKLTVCEYIDNNISILGRKQEDYNQRIKNCDIFFMLVGEKLGGYTKEEYITAKQSNREIHIVFYQKSENPSVIEFKKEISTVLDIHTYQSTNNKELKYILGKIITNHLQNWIPITIDQNNITIDNHIIELS